MQNKNITSIMLVLLHAISVAFVFAGVKYLSQSFRSVEVVFLYKASLFIVVLPYVICCKKWRDIWNQNTPLLIVRGILTSIASISFMYALQHVDIVNATALGYLEQIVWIIIGLVFFHEKLTSIKAMAIITSFAGAILIIFPNLLKINQGNAFEFNSYYGFILFAVLCWGTNAGVIKRLSKKVDGVVQVLYSTFFATIISSLVALYQWQVVDGIYLPISYIGINSDLLELSHFKYIVAITACYYMHSIAFIFAVRGADFSLIMPYDYFRLLFTGALNYLLFNILEEWTAILGYILIVVAGLTLARSEYIKSKTKNYLNSSIKE